MRIRVVAVIAALALAGTLAACSTGGTSPSSSAPAAASSDEEMMETEEMMEPDEMMARTGVFEGLNDKSVSGTVSVTDSEIVLSEFSSDEGPDLHVYLANGTDESAVADGIEIGTVAFDEASQTFSLSGVDSSQYSDVVIHCDKAAAVFGAAPIG